MRDTSRAEADGVKITWKKQIIDVLVFVPIILLLTACRFSDSPLPTILPKANPGADSASDDDSASGSILDESPRTGLEIEVPATWTPASNGDLQNQNPINQSTPSSVDEAEDSSSPRRTYIVQQGDTLAEIAIEYNVTLEELARINNISDIDHIEAGQELIIPGS